MFFLHVSFERGHIEFDFHALTQKQLLKILQSDFLPDKLHVYRISPFSFLL